MTNAEKSLRVGVVGLGEVSPVHLQAIEDNDHADLVAVCDRDDSLKPAGRETAFYTDYKQMINECRLDVVHICLPHHLHYPVTKHCAEAGIHVFLEKPLSISYEEALKQKDLEDTTDSKICVCFQNRYNPTFTELVNWLSKKETSPVTGIKGLVTWFRKEEYYTLRPWRKTKAEVGYGNIMSQSIHALDLIAVLGGEVDSVKATLSKLLDYESEVEDTASAVFNFSSGAKGYLHATNANISNSSVELEVQTEHERFWIKDGTLYRTDQAGDTHILAEDDRVDGAKSYFGASHKRLIDVFYTAILDDTDEYVTVKEALPSIQLIEMMAASSRTVVEPDMITADEFLTDMKG
ncbi:Predicted dehydrogenase [Alkalibacterium putridalgicola]|uniref:Oxidoreductase n=1 Tax=Alkalibacterium putridalgicola TaxID=426703 RepID=A0A1H7R9I5_9LACT|nr:Gfo/Idh/MocA family oxidoreductase [Alkalibacterium putridalgicola]GEK88845.1 oxidoreductase [Alkalibacterium putridalgicola]SEL56921.1 Predicted dehydrogenase [Alkalibacterium putridalgicola]